MRSLGLWIQKQGRGGRHRAKAEGVVMWGGSGDASVGSKEPWYEGRAEVEMGVGLGRRYGKSCGHATC